MMGLSNTREVSFDLLMRIALLTIILCGKSHGFQRTESFASTDQQLAKDLRHLLNNYDSRIRPNYTGRPVEILVDFSVASFANIREVEMEFGLDMFFRQRWQDKRLSHNMTTMMTLTMGTKHPADYIWVPDTMFVDATKSYMHNVLATNHKVDISEKGEVNWGTRATLTARCHMNFRTFPMDEQTCSLSIVSYAYPTNHLIFTWKSNPGVIVLDKEMAQFYMTNMTTAEQRVQYVAGEYSVLQATFTFKRRMGFYLIQIYVPCIAVVFVAWMSLFVDSKATPARVGLCITTLLTVATIWGSVNSTMPRVSYVKAIDIYLMTSFFFVLCTMLEYIILIHKGRAKRSILLLKAPFLQKDNLQETYCSLTSDYSCYRGGLYSMEEAQTHSPCKESPKDTSSPPDSKEINSKDVEIIARIAFVIAFTIFNLVYWIVLVYFV